MGIQNLCRSTNIARLKRWVGLVVLTLALPLYAYAQTPPIEPYQTAEAISGFHTEIRVNVDNSIDVTETITYHTAQGVQKHGIFRSIRLSNAAGDKIDATNLRFTDEKGYYVPATFVGDTEIASYRIGDPNSTFTGERTYVISYHVKDAVSHLREIDEIYWNSTGNSWPFPILHASADVVLPNARKGTQSACYVGPTGSTERCISHYADGTVTPQFETKAPLEAGSGLTVAVGFPKDVVTQPTLLESLWDQFRDMIVFIVLLTPFPIVIFLSRKRIQYYWKRHKYYSTHAIIPEYDAGTVSPMVASGLVNGTISGREISATIVALAIRGYLTINNMDGKYGFPVTDKPTTDLTPSELLIVSGVGNKTEADLKYKFAKTTEEIGTKEFALLLTAGLISAVPMLGSKINGLTKWFGSLLLIFFAINPGVFVFIMFGPEIGYLFSGTCVVGAIFLLLFDYQKPLLTDQGLETERRLLGLMEYMRVAEVDRIKFSNAPEKNPKTFERLLPYAMVFGLEKEWARQFEGIYELEPEWHSSRTHQPFSPTSFGNEMRRFSLTTGALLATARGSRSSGGGRGGSGGGGHSGGGGGGGGGGSW